MQLQGNLRPSTDVSTVILEHIEIYQTVAMFAIGSWNGLEVGLKTFDYFKEYRGLYFWSMQIASWGIVLYSIPAQLLYVSLGSSTLDNIFFMIGWCAMVTGQAVVVYSRLHLVVRHGRCLRFALGMIITNAILFHTPHFVLYLDEFVGNNRKIHYVGAIFYYAQAIAFCLQDLFLCTAYMLESMRALKPVLEMRGREGRQVLVHMMVVNAFIMVMTAALTVVVFLDPTITAGFKAVVTSIKLKLEFMILNRLRGMICARPDEIPCPQRQIGYSDENIFDILDRDRERSRETDSRAALNSNSITPTVHSIPNSTFDFHQALRETSSSDNMSSLHEQQPTTPEKVRGWSCSRRIFGSPGSESTAEKGLIGKGNGVT